MFFDNKLKYIVYTVLKTMNKCNVKDMHTHLLIYTCTYIHVLYIHKYILNTFNYTLFKC